MNNGGDRYLVFAHTGWQPKGGWRDYKCAAPSIELALLAAKNDENNITWYHIVDTITGRIVDEGVHVGRAIHDMQ